MLRRSLLLLVVLFPLSLFAEDFIVTSTGDSGPGTLRQAILEANSGACELCVIKFAFPGEVPPRPQRQTLRIDLQSELPELRAHVTKILGASAELIDIRSEVIIDGSRAGAGAAGLRVRGVRFFQLVGVTFQNFGGGGMVIDQSEGLQIHAAGFNDSGADGLVIRDSVIGRVSQSTFHRNRVNGIVIQRSTNIDVENSGIGAAVIDFENNEPAPNGGNGVHLDDARACSIGSNVIRYNGGNGILVTGADAAENSLVFNEFGDNAFLAVDLGGDGPTPNDPRDADSGPNHLQNTPVIESARYNRGVLRVRGHLDGEPNTKYAVMFWSVRPDPTGSGEGVHWLLTEGPLDRTSDADGRLDFTFDFGRPFRVDITPGNLITATASRVVSQAEWESSEFSRNVQIVEDEITHEVTNTADAGPGSLRAAIEAANADECSPAFVCEIAFLIPTPPNAQGVWTIQPRSPLPAIRRSGVWLDGATQTQHGGNTNPDGPEVEINGALCGACNGVEIRATDRTVDLTLIRDVIINGFSGHGVSAQGQPARSLGLGARVDGSYIGTDATATRAVPNGGSGIHIVDAFVNVGTVGDNRINARGPARNVISGNRGDGITSVATARTGAGIIALGNIISSDRTGFYPLANGGNGITSGGSARIEQNIIGFSAGAGVLVTGEPVNGIINNIIHSNGGPGIDIRSTPEQAPPVIESARFANGKTVVRYTLDAPPREFPGWYWVDVFAASFTDASGNGEGRRLLMNHVVNNKNGTSYEIEIPENLTGKFISMTATPFDTFYYAPSATSSEFARSVQVTAEGCDGANATLESPANGARATGATTFRWSAVPGAIVYRMWVMKPGGPVQLVYEGATPNAVVTLEAGTYEWWIETRFACYGPQTEHRTITIE